MKYRLSLGFIFNFMFLVGNTSVYLTSSHGKIIFKKYTPIIILVTVLSFYKLTVDTNIVIMKNKKNEVLYSQIVANTSSFICAFLILRGKDAMQSVFEECLTRGFLRKKDRTFYVIMVVIQICLLVVRLTHHMLSQPFSPTFVVSMWLYTSINSELLLFSSLIQCSINCYTEMDDLIEKLKISLHSLSIVKKMRLNFFNIVGLQMRINETFGARSLLAIIHICVFLLQMSGYSVNLILSYPKVSPTLGHILKLCYCLEKLLIVFVIAQCCSKASARRKDLIISIVSLENTPFMREETMKEVSILIQDLNQNDIPFTAWGCFRLDKGMFYSVITIISKYVLLILPAKLVEEKLL